MNQNIFQFTAKTFFGLESVLAQELKAMNLRDVEPLKRAVRFKGSLEDMYRVNYKVRLALRILTEIKRFRVKNENDLYRQAKQIDWAEFISYKNTFAIDKTVYSDNFKNTHFAALKVKDAIVDYFRDKTGIRPSVDTRNADVRIDLYISGNQGVLSIDTSGDALFKRGYRERTNDAPLNEILAAGIVDLCEIPDNNQVIYDPMCGSGTILVEAAYKYFNIPSGYLRKKYAFMNLKNFNRVLWKKVKQQADAEINYQKDIKFYGSDIAAPVLKLARKNIENAGLANYIELSQKDFADASAPANSGVIITNPPYDQRLKSDDIMNLYKTIGDTLKHNFTGWTAYIFSGNPGAMKAVGLKRERNIQLFNGKIEAQLRKFSLYEGSKKNNQVKRKH